MKRCLWSPDDFARFLDRHRHRRDELDQDLALCDEGLTCTCHPFWLAFYREVQLRGGVWFVTQCGVLQDVVFHDEYEEATGAP
jgi:hypothetical protein